MKTREPAVGHEAHGRRVRGRQDASPSSSPRRSASTGARPSSSGRSATQLGGDPLPGRRGRRSATRSTPAATGSRRRSTGRCRRRSRSGSTRRPGRPTCRTPTTHLKDLKIPPATGAGSRTSAARTSTTAPPRVIDYRTGQVLAYAGSAATPPAATKKFQPQFDVLSDGWRQPGSSIKPINYAIGIEDQHDDRGDDVHGRRRRTSAAGSSRPRPTTPSAARSASARRSSSR